MSELKSNELLADVEAMIKDAKNLAAMYNLEIIEVLEFAKMAEDRRERHKQHKERIRLVDRFESLVKVFEKRIQGSNEQSPFNEADDENYNPPGGWMGKSSLFTDEKRPDEEE